MSRRRPTPGPTVTLLRLPLPAPDRPETVPGDLPGDVVFVTNAVRARGGLRTRGDQRRHVLAAVLA